MAGLNQKQTVKNLKTKGFVEKNKADKHLELWHDGKYILHTFISHGSSHEIGNSLIHKMADQCKLTKIEFLDLARCPMKQEVYMEILKTKGLLD
jgi:predicted RNA binding protein YcfA (HicA-like mRNA interferase family)